MKAQGICLKLCAVAAWICTFLLLQLQVCLPGSGNGQSFSQARAEVQEMSAVREPPPAIFVTDLARYSDDAVALLMLLRSRALDIKGIITTAGNVCAGDAAQYVRSLLQSAGAQPLPVIEGPPLSWYEGRRRFYLEVERPSWERKDAYVGAFSSANPCTAEAFTSNRASAASQANRAADFLIDVARQHAGRLVIVLASPATVLAQALRIEPKLAGMLSHIYAMGGSINVPGNVSPYAEFNVWFDPEAAAALFHSGTRLTLVPLDATNPVVYDPASMEGLQRGGPGAKYLAQYLAFRHAEIRKVPMWDEVTAAAVIDPSVVSNVEEHFLTVSTDKTTQYGKVSILPAAESASQVPVKVITRVDASKVREILTGLVIEKE